MIPNKIYYNDSCFDVEVRAFLSETSSSVDYQEKFVVIVFDDSGKEIFNIKHWSGVEVRNKLYDAIINHCSKGKTV